MSNGSMQFLGRQLTEQAKQLGLLVEKMALMVQKQDESIPKFAMESDEIQKQGDIAFSGTDNVFQALQYPIKVYLSGKIRVKITAVASGKTIDAYIKGVKITSTQQYPSTSSEKFFDIQVQEGDTINLGMPGGGNSVSVSTIKVCYTLIDKPNVVL